MGLMTIFYCLTDLGAFILLPGVDQLVRVLLAFATAVIPGFSLLEIHDQDFCSLLDMYVLRNGASSSTRGSVFLCRSYACCTIILA
jgi:hypothetical protein